MANRSTTLGAPGPRPLGAQARPAQPNGIAPAGATSMTLGTLREVRNELASLGELLERMSADMNGLRRAVEAVAARGPGTPQADEGAKKDAKAARRAAKADAARDEREAALAVRIEKLERQVKRLKRQADWLT